MLIKSVITSLLVSICFSTVSYATQTIDGGVKSTPANDAGKGNIIFLDRHTVNCKDRALNYFGLIRPSAYTIGYNYSCQNINIGKKVLTNTEQNDAGGGNVIYLDRHSVECDGHPLVGFNLYRPTADTISYKYVCGHTLFKETRSYQTPPVSDWGGSSLALTSLRVRCPLGGSITGFQLTRPSETTVAYKYTCGYGV